MALGDIYQVSLKYTLQNQNIVNVLHYVVTADADYSAFVAGMKDQVENEIFPAMLANLSQDVTTTGHTTQKIWPLPAFFPAETGFASSGLEPTFAMPAEVATVLTKQTILAGRAYRGRLYIAGAPLTAMDPVTGLWTVPYRTGFAGMITALKQVVLSDPVGGTLTPVIYHRTSHLTTNITEIITRGVPRAQRRRQIGRGV